MNASPAPGVTLGVPATKRRIEYRKYLSRITFQQVLLPSAWRSALELHPDRREIHLLDKVISFDDA